MPRVPDWLRQLALVVAGVSALYVLWLPDVTPLRRSNPRTTAFIELRREQAESREQSFRPTMVWVPWDDISDHLKLAVLVAEDDAFFKHGGVDWNGVREALRRDWEKKRFAYGASTITQQVARNLYLSPSKNPLRKLKELLIAWRLERQLGKRRIFEIYLNVAEWGRGIYGCEAAARAYFGKGCRQLDAREASALAVVLPNPRRWKPVGANPHVARSSHRLLKRMRASGLVLDAADWDRF